MANIIILEDIGSGTSHRLPIPCVIGRSPDNDLSLTDETVSQRHAKILDENGSVIIEDLGSRNGVFVNGFQVEKRAALSPGDSIQVGRVTLKYDAPPEECEGTLILHSLDSEAKWEPDSRRLKWIYEMTLDLAGHQKTPHLEGKILSRLKQLFCCNQCYLGIFQDDGTLGTILSEPAVEEGTPVSQSIINRLLLNGESFILADALSEDALNMQESITALRIRSAMCVPLVSRDNIYGLIYLACDTAGVYNQTDLEFLKAIASIIAPKIENARLWEELNHHLQSAMETLRKTQSRLMKIERAKAYIWLAQAMAHEIRNPVMIIGGMVRRLEKESSDSPKSGFQAIFKAAERVEEVLREVDHFVSLPRPEKSPVRIDELIEEELEATRELLEKSHIKPVLRLETSRLKVPLDGELFRKSIELVLRELPADVPGNSEVHILVRESNNCVEILIGPKDEEPLPCQDGDEQECRPSGIGLFLNLASKIISDQDGEILPDTSGPSPFPLIIRMPIISYDMKDIN